MREIIVKKIKHYQMEIEQLNAKYIRVRIEMIKCNKNQSKWTNCNEKTSDKLHGWILIWSELSKRSLPCFSSNNELTEQRKFTQRILSVAQSLSGLMTQMSVQSTPNHIINSKTRWCFKWQCNNDDLQYK